jgi:hypothetical protein
MMSKEMSKEVTRAGRTRRIRVREGQHQTGWEVSVEQDSQVVKKVTYDDWHRVERAVSSFSKDTSDTGKQE